MTPRITVGVPVYNGERYLAATLDSLLNQTVEDFVVLVGDNASTDRTAEIARSYAARDPRVRYHRSPVNRGMAWNYNRTFELATGTYVVWLGHDDVMWPEYLNRCVATAIAQMGGPERAPHTPRRSSRPGEAGALLDTA